MSTSNEISYKESLRATGIIIVVIICIALFYMYSRNNSINKTCEQQSLDRSIEGAPFSKYPETVDREIRQNQLYREYFQECLILNGAQ